MTTKTYCISKSYDCTDNDDLLQIIAILRQFKFILETRLLDCTVASLLSRSYEIHNVNER